MTVRIDVRPDREAKARLDRAAAKLGIPLSSFVLSAALERAQLILSQDARVLSDRDRDRILALLDAPRPMRNAAFRKAAQRHSELIARSKEL